MNRVARTLNVLLPRLWMRGLLPSVCVLLLGLFSTGTWIIWTAKGTIGAGTAPVRAALGKGVIIVNWNWPTPKRWIGGNRWSLGVMHDGAGTVQSGWVVSPPLWSASRLNEINFGLEIHPNHVKVPLLWAWILFAVPPAGWMIWKRVRHRPAGACAHCGYDLSGSTLDLCPECGRASPKANSRGPSPAAATTQH